MLSNEIELSFHGSPQQLKAFQLWNDNHTKQIVYGGAKYGGKSFLGASLIFSQALTYPNTSWFIARRELNDLRKFTTPTIIEVLANWNLTIADVGSFNGQDNYYKLHNGSMVYYLECKPTPADPLFERFGSMQFTGGWIEEGGEVDQKAKDNLFIAVGRKMNKNYGLLGKILITCNPKKNWLYNDFYKPHRDVTLPPDKAIIFALPTDNIFGDKNYIHSLSQMKERLMLERLYYGNWEYEDDDMALMKYDAIQSIFTNTYITGTGKRYISADIARMGKDSTIIRAWDGWRVVERVELNKANTIQVAGAIHKLAMKYSIPKHHIIADEDGVGGGVVDALKCKGFIANSRPINLKPNEQYDNLKSQCAFIVANKVNNGEIYESCSDEVKQKLTQELGQIKQKETDGKLGLVSKDIMKRALGRSPDDADTYIMRACFEVAVAGGVVFM